jgi:hypothetical protein
MGGISGPEGHPAATPAGHQKEADRAQGRHPRAITRGHHYPGAEGGILLIGRAPVTTVSRRAYHTARRVVGPKVKPARLGHLRAEHRHSARGSTNSAPDIRQCAELRQLRSL